MELVLNMSSNKNRLAFILIALFAMTVLAACTQSKPEATATPVPTATPTPVPVESIDIDPVADPQGFLAALPQAEVDCAASAVGGMDVLIELISFEEGVRADISDPKLKVLASCMSDDTMRKIVVGQLEIETGGLSATTAACVANHTDGIDFASMFSGQTVEPETVISTLQALFCLSAQERLALESSDQQIIEVEQLGGIDALECAIDGAGPNGITAFSEIFQSDGDVDPLAVGQFMPLLIDCGVVDNSSFEESGITSEQFACLFETIDSTTLASFLSSSDSPSESLDLSGAASVLAAMGSCGLDLQKILDASVNGETVTGEGTGSSSDPLPIIGGEVVSSDILFCLTDNGVSVELAASYAAGLTDDTEAELIAALAVCQGEGSDGGGEGSSGDGGIVIPDGNGGSTTLDPTIFDSLPITAEQAECLINEIGIEQMEGIAAGTTSPIAVLPALGACNISIADLIAA